LNTALDKKDDIARCCPALICQIINVLCFLRVLLITKMKLLISYCYSLYGCAILDITSLQTRLRNRSVIRPVAKGGGSPSGRTTTPPRAKKSLFRQLFEC